MASPIPPVAPSPDRARAAATSTVANRTPAQRSANLQKEAAILKSNPTSESALHRFLSNTKPDVNSDGKLNRQQLHDQYQAANQALAGSGHDSPLWSNYSRKVYGASATTGQSNGHRVSSEVYDKALEQGASNPEQVVPEKPTPGSNTRPVLPTPVVEKEGGMSNGMEGQEALALVSAGFEEAKGKATNVDNLPSAAFEDTEAAERMYDEADAADNRIYGMAGEKTVDALKEFFSNLPEEDREQAQKDFKERYNEKHTAPPLTTGYQFFKAVTAYVNTL